jgi:hypothetical protein
MATPLRPLPGAYQATPAAIRPDGLSSRPPAFRLPSNPSLQRPPANPSQLELPQASGGKQPLTDLERASNGINQFLAYEARFPAMEDYIPRKRPSRTICLHLTNIFQRELPPTTNWIRVHRMRPSIRSRATIYPTKSLKRLKTVIFPQNLVFSQRFIVLGLRLTMPFIFGTTRIRIQSLREWTTLMLTLSR